MISLAIAKAKYFFKSIEDSVHGQSKGNYAQLCHLCMNDKESADRLIALERSRSNGISDGEACHRAIQRIIRDNR